MGHNANELGGSKPDTLTDDQSKVSNRCESPFPVPLINWGFISIIRNDGFITLTSHVVCRSCIAFHSIA